MWLLGLHAGPWESWRKLEPIIGFAPICFDMFCSANFAGLGSGSGCVLSQTRDSAHNMEAQRHLNHPTLQPQLHSSWRAMADGYWVYLNRGVDAARRWTPFGERDQRQLEAQLSSTEVLEDSDEGGGPTWHDRTIPRRGWRVDILVGPEKFVGTLG